MCFIDVSRYPSPLIFLILEKNEHTYIAIGRPAPHWFFFFARSESLKRKHGGWFQTQKWKRNESSTCFEVCVWSWSEWGCAVWPVNLLWVCCVPIYVCQGRGKLVQKLCFFGTCFFYRLHWFEEKKITSNIEKTHAGLTHAIVKILTTLTVDSVITHFAMTLVVIDVIVTAPSILAWVAMTLVNIWNKSWRNKRFWALGKCSLHTTASEHVLESGSEYSDLNLH